jgi:hypothetical protein
VGQSRAEFERDRAALGHGPQPTNNVAQFIHPRVPGQCVKELKFWTGNVAVKIGSVEIEWAPRMIYVFAGGHQAYTFSREHLTDLNKFDQHFVVDKAAEVAQ